MVAFTRLIEVVMSAAIKDECGFCGKDKTMADRIISGPVVGVCNECIKLLGDMIREGDNGRTKKT